MEAQWITNNTLMSLIEKKEKSYFNELGGIKKLFEGLHTSEKGIKEFEEEMTTRRER